MGLSRQILNTMRDKRGSAVMLFGLLAFFAVFLLGLYVMDYRILLTERDKVDDAVVGAELAALGTANREELGYGVIEIPEEEAQDVFKDYLNQNLQGVIEGLPVIEDFEVYNPGEYPAVCPEGRQIRETAVHSVVRVRVKRPVLRGILGDTMEFRIHRDSDDVFN